jgi:hypothetical protein
MNYLTNYYKNLCQELQEQINLLEAGLKKAMRSGKPELLKKEALKQGAKWDRLKAEAAKHRAEGLKATRRFGPTSQESGAHHWQAMTKDTQAAEIMKNLINIDQELDVKDRAKRKQSSGRYVTPNNIEGILPDNSD